MTKNIVMVLAVLLFIGCSEKEPTPVKAPAKKVVVSQNKEVNDTVPADFVPEHIRKSKIEVVKHY